SRCPIDHLSERHQEPARVIMNRSDREDSRSFLFTKHLPWGEATLRFIGAQLDRNLAAYAMRAADDPNDDRLGVQLLAPCLIARSAR
ncbi:MAG TPA: hypothetical protein VK494_07590, partial [Gemmatimonadaceae bacterium]|nr:hypothetical protein [Gemmatimonadaceae bacterium]